MMNRHIRTRLLWGLVLIWIIGLCIGQLSTLPTLREQVASGLKSGLEEIMRGIAQDVSDSYEERVHEELRTFTAVYELGLQGETKAAGLAEQKTKLIESGFAEAWAIALPDSLQSAWTVHEYLPYSRLRSEAWTSETQLGIILNTQLPLTYDHWGEEATDFWQRTIDSTLLLYYQENNFDETKRIACQPLFHKTDGGLIGFACLQVRQEMIGSSFLPTYFRTYFSTDRPKRKDGISYEFLDIRIRDEESRIIYQSTLLGGSSPEVSLPISQVSPYLGLLSVDVGFQGKLASEVADSVHRRNVWTVIAVFAVLLLLFILIFRTFLKSQRLNQLKSDFLANISHELKTPLSAIRLANDTLRFGRYQSEEQMNKSLNIIHREQEKLQRLLTTLLDFSQMDMAKRVYEMERIEINDWWQTYFPYVKQKVLAQGFEISANVSDSHAACVGDSEAIRDVLDILIDNAMKYAGDARKIVVHSSVAEKEWKLSVEDFGIGIPKQDREAIFEKFTRLSSSDIHDIKGYGLGLSIAKSIMAAHRGRISVVSHLGAGSQFTIHVPLHAT